MSLKNKIGKIPVTKTALDHYIETRNFAELFNDLIVIHIEYDYSRDLFTYTCISHLFDPVENGCEIPFYSMNVVSTIVDKIEIVKK